MFWYQINEDFMSKSKYILFMFLVLFLLVPLCADDTQKKLKADTPSEKTYYKNTIFIGLNHSQLFANNEIGKTSFNLGYYRRNNLMDNLYIKYGLKYADIKMDILDIDIYNLHEDDMIHRDTDIHVNYDVFELNLFFEYLISKNKSFSLAPLVGLGYAQFTYFLNNTGYDWGEHDYYDESIDNIEGVASYTDANLDFINSGFILHAGMSLICDRYHCDITYSNHLKHIQSLHIIDLTDRWMNLYTLNLELGYYF
jgi:hypothetical protein